MFRYGKTARQAVAAISYVAERQAAGAGAVSSAETGTARKIPRMLAAKLLSEMSAAGLLVGTTGPGGGYRLARPAKDISLSDIVSLFEREQEEFPCPFGPGWCGTGEQCPLHDSFIKIDSLTSKFLEATSLEVFTRNGSKLPAATAKAKTKSRGN